MHDTKNRYIEVEGEPWCLARDNALNTLTDPQLRAVAKLVKCSSANCETDAGTLRRLGFGAVIVEDECMGAAGKPQPVVEKQELANIDEWEAALDPIETEDAFENVVYDALYDALPDFYYVENMMTFDEAGVTPHRCGLLVDMGPHRYEVSIKKIK